jgi:hypothetical protein
MLIPFLSSISSKFLDCSIFNTLTLILYVYILSFIVVALSSCLTVDAKRQSLGTANNFNVCLNKRLDCGLQHCETTDIRSVVVK